MPTKAPLSFRYYHILWSGLDLLFPPHCAGCGTLGWRWCPTCASGISRPVEPICAICGIPLDRPAGICDFCRAARPRYCALRSWSLFENPVRNALHHLKYRRDIGLGEALTPALAESLAALHWPVDIVVPVPLGKKRLAERGYNQASLIARPLSMAMRMAYASDALIRSQETRSQVGLTRTQRQRNVCNAFRAKPSRVKGRIVLLVDDVATTGSTLSSCAEALYAAGAQDVFAFTVSRATPRHGLRTV
ncbi:MAG TPA: ComF family protein [Anaerolineales bacterium]